MTLPRFRRLCATALCFGLGAALCADVAAEQDEEPSKQVSELVLPQGLDVQFRGQLKQTPEGDILFNDAVTITWRDTRIQADRVSLREERFVEAEGSVLIVWAGNRIFGTRITYDLETEQGVIENAIGQIESDYMFWAKSAQKIGEDTVHLRSATVTTCTQPTPYWSFAVSSAIVRIDHYAKMWNVRLKALKMPVFYLPYLVWPVKPDRATGLLLPEFSSNEELGTAITEELFIPLGPSADLTLLGRWYTKAGFGLGGQFRMLPNPNGAATVSGFFIDDKVNKANRYSFNYEQTQQFQNGFRMLADIDVVSDFDFYQDFARKLELISSPTIQSRLEFSRNGKWTSMNVRELRRKNLIVGGNELVQQSLPEVEWRGRTRQLAKSPFYLSYESSVALIQQRGNQPTNPIDADYFRGDAFPVITAPITAVPWLDITPKLSYRYTFYSQSQETIDVGGLPSQVIVDDSLSRELFSGGIDMIGPRFYSIYDSPDSSFSPRYKHTIEPTFSYIYQQGFDRNEDIITYDEVDLFSSAGNLLNYGVVQRLFAQRPRALPETAATSVERIIMPDGTTSNPASQILPDQSPPGPATAEAAAAQPREPVEVATLEIRQTRTFEDGGILSFGDLDGDGVNETVSQYSPMSIIGRFNPNPLTSFDLRSAYDIVYDQFRGATLSGTLRNQLARVRFSIVYRNGLGVRNVGTPGVPIFEPIRDDTQIRLTTGLSFFRGKMLLDLDGTYNSNPGPGERHVPNIRWRIQYSNECCTFLVERLRRDFTDASRDDYYFRIDLKGVGKLLDFKY